MIIGIISYSDSRNVFDPYLCEGRDGRGGARESRRENWIIPNGYAEQVFRYIHAIQLTRCPGNGQTARRIITYVKQSGVERYCHIRKHIFAHGILNGTKAYIKGFDGEGPCANCNNVILDYGGGDDPCLFEWALQRQCR